MGIQSEQRNQADRIGTADAKRSAKAAAQCDVLVIGAGPGGLSAAAAAAAELQRTDDDPQSAAGERTQRTAGDPQIAAGERTQRTAGDPQTATGERTQRAAGDPQVVILEREEIPGGILNQCVHDGFGIVRYGAQLSGPEYAEIEQGKAEESGVRILTGYMVTEIEPATATSGPDAVTSGPDAATSTPEAQASASEAAASAPAASASAPASFAVTAISRSGRHVFHAKAVVLATGCRERTRGMLSIPGTRPAGIFTAGVAQNLINRKNIMVGRRVVILGSGDIGLIMARRLTLEGAQVLCAAEVMEEPTGLARNVRQCLFDFDIPLYLRTGVSNIYGKDRLEGVELSQVDEDLRPIPGTGRRIDCDTLILSVGLIPENEVAKTAGVALDQKGGAATDLFLQTSVPGIFACGNTREVMDLADFVSEQGEVAGRNAAAFAAGQPLQKWGKNLHNAARKGMPEEGSVTCTLCPKGCQVKIEQSSDPTGDETQDWIITGNGCPRGAAFARQEMTDPQRILTTTMKIAGAPEHGTPEHEATNHGTPEHLIPVRSDGPVPLGEMKEIAEALSRIVLPQSQTGSSQEGSRPDALTQGIRRGQILVRDVGSTHVNIIAERG